MKIIYFALLFFLAIQMSLAQSMCRKDFLKTTLRNHGMETPVLLVWFPINAGASSVLHMCSNETGQPLQRNCVYNRARNVSEWETINNNIELINCTSIPQLCREETFEHNYIMKNNKIEHVSNKWKITKMTEIGGLEKPCLLKTGLPLTRRCLYNPFMGMADWELLSPDVRNISCLRETRELLITYDLNTLYQEVKDNMTSDKTATKKVVQQMSELLRTSQTVRIPADIKISSDILKIVTEDNKNPELVDEVLNVTDIIMAEKRETIIKSEKVNATTTLLKTIDSYLHSVAGAMVPTSECRDKTDGIVYTAFERTSVFYINPACSNISGVGIYNRNLQRHHHYLKHQRYDKHTGHYYRFFYLNQTLDEILSEPELSLATYFPLSLWNKLKTISGAVTNETVLTFLIFKNDYLFVNNTRMDKRPHRNILEISMPNYTGELPADVPFVFNYKNSRHESSHEHPPDCGYWNYSTWTTTGIKTEYKNISNNNLVICHSSHLTHFAAIFGVSFSSTSFSLGDSIMLSISHDIILDYISILGCGMSLLGLSFIWLTAVCFKSFRAEPSNKVLLHLSFVLSLLMLFFLSMNFPQWTHFIDMENSLQCTIMGVFLHYIIIVLFFWMLIIAVMQYQRYVTVLGYERPSNYIAKYAVFAWGVPLIPVAVVAYMQPTTYMPNTERILNNTGICYPSGDSLLYGVILPIGIIMLANLSIFVYIFWSLHRSLSQFEHRGSRENFIIQFRVSIFLFFLLGISWLFGLLSRWEGSSVFSYIFCITSTLQGFVLFIYSIIVDKSTRASWIILFCCATSYKTKEEKEEMKYMNRRSRPNKFN